MEKFNRHNSFSLWCVKMCVLLVQQGLAKALMGKEKLPAMMSEDDKEELDLKALFIFLCQHYTRTITFVPVNTL